MCYAGFTRKVIFAYGSHPYSFKTVQALSVSEQFANASIV